MDVLQSLLLHFSQRVIDVPTIKFVVTAYVNHRARKDLISPPHPSRFDINITRQHDQVVVPGHRLERRKFVVQI
ncbi:hypothetical protein D3C71_1790040 [compost metagenome]